MRVTEAAALFLVLLTGCSDTCQNTTVLTAEPPTGDLKAVLFSRDCGSTTAFSSQVSIITGDEAIDGVGNAFVADTGSGAAKAEPWGGPRVEMRWIAPGNLLVRYDAKARVFTQRESVAGVRIRYEPVGR